MHTVHVEFLDTDGRWLDSIDREFIIVPVTGDFITMSFGTFEVIKRVVRHGANEIFVADITVKMAD